MKIEVGKKYKCEDDKRYVKYVDVIAHRPEVGNFCFITIVYFTDGRTPYVVLFREDGYSSHYQIIADYTEPKEFVRYFNIYADDDCFSAYHGHSSRREADEKSKNGPNRIACQRVVFKEGVFDD